MQSGKPPEHDLRAVLRLQQADGERRVRVRRRELEREALQDHGEPHLGLEQSEVLTDAGARAPAEGEERRREPRRLGDPHGEPLRSELARVETPHVLVVVDAQQRQHQHHARRVSHATELHRLVRLAVERRQRRVQPQHLIQHHRHLQSRNNATDPSYKSCRQMKLTCAHHCYYLRSSSDSCRRNPASVHRTREAPPPSRGPATPGAC
jgi:hypothetical protein